MVLDLLRAAARAVFFLVSIVVIAATYYLSYEWFAERGWQSPSLLAWIAAGLAFLICGAIYVIFPRFGLDKS
jgi:hypothetical protein